MQKALNDNFKTYLISSILKSIQNEEIKSWKTGANVEKGEQFVYGLNVYMAYNSGETGLYAPTHIVGEKSDGNINWMYVRSFSENDLLTHLYGAIGKKEEWEEEDSPPTFIFNSFNRQEIMNELIALKKIHQEDIRFGAKKNRWEFNKVYDEFDDESSLLNKDFFVINSSRKLYKCLSNNKSSQSENEPTKVSDFPFMTSDGYVWKYIGEISLEDFSDFSTNEYIPIKRSINESTTRGKISHFKPINESTNVNFTNVEYKIFDLTGDDLLLDIQYDFNDLMLKVFLINEGKNFTKSPWLIIYEEPANQVTFAELSVQVEKDQNNNGFISSINIENNNPGLNYPNDVSLIIVGDGTGAEATATIVEGSLSEIAINENGTGYTWAKAFLIPGLSYSVQRGVIQPNFGHGTDLIEELFIKSLIINFSINNDPIYFAPEEISEFRRFNLLSNLRDDNQNILTKEMYVGPSHSNYSSNSINKIDSNFGVILYQANFRKIKKVENQQEIYQILIEL